MVSIHSRKQAGKPRQYSLGGLDCDSCCRGFESHQPPQYSCGSQPEALLTRTVENSHHGNMKISTYLLPAPPWKPKSKPYRSSWKMTSEEAAKHGLTDADIVPGTTEETKDLGMQAAGLDGVRSQEKK